jgi:non-ribosomal peptide synthetase component F
MISLDALAHSSVPFYKLVEELKPPRDLRHTPLFQVSFMVSNLAQTGLSFPGIVSSPIKLETHTAKFDLTLAITESDERLRGTFEYSTELFEAETIKGMIERLVAIVEEMPNRLNERIKDLMPISKPQWRTRAAGDNLSVTSSEQTISAQLQLCAEQLQVMTRQLRSLRDER